MKELSITATERDTVNMVRSMYNAAGIAHFPYHNLAHTEQVVAHSNEMARFYQLNESDAFILIIAAWFHDIGHLYGDIRDHEERGVAIMDDYLKTVSPELKSAIGRCIMATKPPSQPQSHLEQIICDADTYHFGTAMFRMTDLLVRREMEMRTGKKFPDWRKKSMELLQKHIFFTGYCRQRLNSGKQQNITWLEANTDY